MVNVAKNNNIVHSGCYTITYVIPEKIPGFEWVIRNI